MKIASVLATSLLASVLAASAALAADMRVAERAVKLTRGTAWKQVAAIPVAFPTFHPQGMIKIGDAFFVSSVDIRKPTTRYSQLQDGYDRDTGEGEGHLFKIGADGKLLADLKLGEGTIYHPGGIDFDGQFIWVPVAEYRPNGQAIIYKVDPATMKAVEVFRFKDHIGGIVHNTDGKSLHGVELGVAAAVQVAARRGRQDHECECEAGGVACHEPRAVYRLPGLPLCRRRADALFGTEQLCNCARGPAVPPRRIRGRRPQGQPSCLAGSDRTLVPVRAADDAEPGLCRSDGQWAARPFLARRRQVDAVYLRSPDS